MQFLYELLIRGDQNGITGIHQIVGRLTRDDDGEFHLKLGKAEPIDADALLLILETESALEIKNLQTKHLEYQALCAEVNNLSSSLVTLNTQIAAMSTPANT